MGSISYRKHIATLPIFPIPAVLPCPMLPDGHGFCHARLSDLLFQTVLLHRGHFTIASPLSAAVKNLTWQVGQTTLLLSGSVICDLSVMPKLRLRDAVHLYTIAWVRSDVLLTLSFAAEIDDHRLRNKCVRAFP